MQEINNNNNHDSDDSMQIKSLRAPEVTIEEFKRAAKKLTLITKLTSNGVMKQYIR